MMMSANSLWHIEASALYVFNLVYFCCSLLEQQIELILSILKTKLGMECSSPVFNRHTI